MMLPKPTLGTPELSMIIERIRRGTGTDVELATPGAATALMTGCDRSDVQLTRNSRFLSELGTGISQGSGGGHLSAFIFTLEC